MFRTGSTSAGHGQPHRSGPDGPREDHGTQTLRGQLQGGERADAEPAPPDAGPSAAERVRTLLESNASAALTLPDGRVEPLGPAGLAPRVLTPTGDVLALLPAGGLAARAAVNAHGDELPAALEITDVAAVAMPHRIRGTAWLAGWLSAVTDPADQERFGDLRPSTSPKPAGASPTDRGQVLVRLEVGEAHLEDLWGTAQVEPDTLAAAEPDPLVACESDLLLHLADAHREQLAQLYGLLDQPPGPAEPPRRVVPVSLDRFGLRVRMIWPENCWDARFDFPAPVTRLTGLRHELHRLFRAAAHSAG